MKSLKARSWLILHSSGALVVLVWKNFFSKSQNDIDFIGLELPPCSDGPPIRPLGHPIPVLYPTRQFWPVCISALTHLATIVYFVSPNTESASLETDLEVWSQKPDFVEKKIFSVGHNMYLKLQREQKNRSVVFVPGSDKMGPILQSFRRLGVIFCVVLFVGVVADDDACSLPQDRGRCRAMKPHFFFNSETK